MANLKEIRNRITSVSSTMQITSAMKMVSAAKLKKAQDAITAMRPYAEKLTELLQNLSATLDGDAGGEFTKQREIKKVLVVAITSNRGLCGAFNTNVIKEVKNRTAFYAGKQVDVFAIGTKGYIGCGDDGGVLNDFWEYTPATDSWAAKATYGGTARTEAGAFAVNGKGYIGTGFDFTSGNLQDFWRYDPPSDTWVQITDFGGAGRRYLSCFVIGTRAFGVFGTSGSLDVSLNAPNEVPTWPS